MRRVSLASATILVLTIVPALAPMAVAAARSAVEPAASDAPAAVAPPGDAAAASVHAGTASPTTGGASADSWRGAAAAVACGLYIKVSLATGGSSVGAIVAAVAACTFMVFDALTT